MEDVFDDLINGGTGTDDSKTDFEDILDGGKLPSDFIDTGIRFPLGDSETESEDTDGEGDKGE